MLPTAVSPCSLALGLPAGSTSKKSSHTLSCSPVSHHVVTDADPGVALEHVPGEQRPGALERQPIHHHLLLHGREIGAILNCTCLYVSTRQRKPPQPRARTLKPKCSVGLQLQALAECVSVGCVPSVLFDPPVRLARRSGSDRRPACFVRQHHLLGCHRMQQGFCPTHMTTQQTSNTLRSAQVILLLGEKKERCVAPWCVECCRQSAHPRTPYVELSRWAYNNNNNNNTYYFPTCVGRC